MMDREEIRARLNGEFDAAVGYSDSTLSADRLQAAEFYQGAQLMKCQRANRALSAQTPLT